MKLIEKAYVGGVWIDAVDGKTFPVYNPATGEVIGNVPALGVSETSQAIEVAEKAFISWKKTTGKERGKILRTLYELIIKNREFLAKTMVMEQGKSIHEARAEIDYSASFVEWFSEEAKRIYGDIVPSINPDQRLFTFKEPVGVVAAITPWNFPTSMITRKIAPAIAAGCTLIVKPSEETPFSALLLAALAEEAGLPKGVLNIITGDSKIIGEVLTSSHAVKMLTFTGSTQVGKLLMSKCSNTVKKVALELGGNSPFIVFADADLDKAVAGVVASKLRNGGQSCICVNRIFVHSALYDEFAKRVMAEFSKVKVGNGLDESVNLGPLINKKAVTKIDHLLDDARAQGAEVLFQATIEKPTDCFYAPTIIKNISNNSLISQDEIFGPVISMFKFEDENVVIAQANATTYGLASYFYTEDRNRIWRVAEALEYGLVGINTVALSSEIASFGGVKESGIGREGGRSGILEYLEDKFIAIS